jgi:hypothetical protein
VLDAGHAAEIIRSLEKAGYKVERAERGKARPSR